MNSLSFDTIAAQATPSGRGGVAIVRISGSQVKSIITTMLKSNLIPRQATYQPFYDTTNQVLDEGIAIFFPSPHSFTGEDILELHSHGGPIVVDLLLQCVLTLGARLARPGEFSERAFINGKMDLTQVEAIADLINASSKQAAKSAIRSLQGEFSKKIHQLNEQIIDLRTYIEAAIDFATEEIDFLSDDAISIRFETILNTLSLIQQQAKQGSLLREGIVAVIMGEPNVGKSSLLNCLSGKEIAIVTDIPGTTRDVLCDDILIDGIPMHIIDTAGLRESDDVIEQEGIRRAYREMERADVVLYVMDARKQIEINLNQLPAALSQCSIVFIRNKIDLTNEAPSISTKNKVVISLSAKDRLGIDLLKNYIKTRVGFKEEIESVFLARRRHLDALSRAKTYLKASFAQLKSCAGELAAEDLRLAHLTLNEITGQFTSDDLLGHIFSSFCIGK
ncbi:MAG TPA: tRNA uridine-5-carboxymethylaminomethyl(34) synthesis GTPase MnmE [Gammaproteobacteria bacterium]|nr:tRNA uridine-5-carboxymethylaminomethyl(34) synthesis GTPase MnmE [Gammaproteobacteria bacterium]